MKRSKIVGCVVLGILCALSGIATAQTLVTSSADPNYAPCRGNGGPGGPCYGGPGGGLYGGPGGGLYSGPGGGLYGGPGGGLYGGPGGGMYGGPGGGTYGGPGGGLYGGPGGGIYGGPPLSDGTGYRGPWGPCITGVLGRQWMQEHCPG